MKAILQQRITKIREEYEGSNQTLGIRRMLHDI
jgi:hypothetical protein